MSGRADSRHLAVEMGPASVEPVGLVGFEFLTSFELVVELGLKGGLHIFDLALWDEAVFDEALGIEGQGRFCAF